MRGPFVSSRVHMSQDFQNPEARYKVKTSPSAEGVRVLTTNVSVNFTQHVVQLDGKELQHPDPKSGNAADLQSSEEFTDLVTSAVERSAVDETIEATYSGTVEKTLLPVSFATAQAQQGKWWHIPDEIAEVLPLPADFEERLEVRHQFSFLVACCSPSVIARQSRACVLHSGAHRWHPMTIEPVSVLVGVCSSECLIFP